MNWAYRKVIAHWARTATFWGLCGLMLLFTVDVDPLAVVASGYTISVLDGLLATVLGMWLVTKVTLLPGDLKTTGGNPRQKQVLWSALTAWFAAMLIAALTARQDVRASLIFWGRSVASMLLVGVIVDMATTRRRFLTLLLALAAGGVLAALGGLLEATSAQPVLDLLATLRGARSFWHFNELLRVSGTFSHPNYLATVMITLLPVLLLLPLALRRRHWRWLPLCGALMCAVVLVLTQSRGAVLASVVSLSGIGVMAWRQRQRAGVWLSAGGVAVVLITGMLYLLLNPAVTIRLVREADDHLWYPAEYVAPATLTAQPNERLTVPVTLMNTSIRAWAIDGKAPVNLTHHIVWMSDGDPMGDENRSRYLVYSGERTPLPRPVLPQESITVQASIIAPAVPGTYAVEWDLIREGVTLFSRKGTPTGQTTLNVSGAVSPAMALTRDFVQITEPSIIREPTRLELWTIALTILGDNPVTGIGMRNFPAMYVAYTGQDLDIPHAHNMYITWLVETGVLGFGAAMLALMAIGWALSPGWQLVRYDVGLWEAWLGLSGGLVAWLLHSLLEVPFSDMSAQLAFWILVGLGVSVAQQSAYWQRPAQGE